MIRLLTLCLVALAQLVPVSAQAQVQAALTSAAPADSAKIPVEHFARIPFVSQPELSPDGNAIAALFRVQGQQVIGIFDLFNSDNNPVFAAMPEGNQANWLQWVNNDNIIVGVSALLPIPGGDRWVVSRLFGLNRPTGKITRLLGDLAGQNGSDLVWSASDGSPTILVAAQNSIYMDEEFWPSVWRVDVQTGRRFPVLKGRASVMDWIADAQGNVRAGINYFDKSRTFSYLYRPAGNSNFQNVDRADTRKREALVRPFLFLPEGNRALAIMDDERGKNAIFEIDLLTQEKIRTVYTAPGEAEVDRVILSDDRTTLLGVRYGGVNGQTAWLDPVLAEIQAAIDKSLSGRRARIVSMSALRDRLLVLVDRPDNPGVYYFFDTASGKMQRYAMVNEPLGARPLNPVRMIQYSARDGLGIEAVLTLPRDRPHKNLPVILMPHGGPWGHDTLDYDYWTQFLASRGYAVIQPNFRGSTGYGSEFLRKGEGQMGLAMQDDISDALAWAVKEGIADPKRACIVGASYGGYAAMWGIAKDPDLYRCSVSIAGVSNVRREVNDFGNAIYGSKYRDDWNRMTPDFAAVSPINAIDRIKAPLLLIHGKKDITVDSNQSTSMNNKMKAAGKSVELLILPEADHSFTREPDRLALLTRLESFLAQHNPADPAPAAAAK